MLWGWRRGVRHIYRPVVRRGVRGGVVGLDSEPACYAKLWEVGAMNIAPWSLHQGAYRVGPLFNNLRDAVAWYVEHLLPQQTINVVVKQGRRVHCVYHA